jgi:hypothetical protein
VLPDRFTYDDWPSMRFIREKLHIPIAGPPIASNNTQPSWLGGVFIGMASTETYGDFALWHEMCHWLVAEPEQRTWPDFGLGVPVDRENYDKKIWENGPSLSPEEADFQEDMTVFLSAFRECLLLKNKTTVIGADEEALSDFGLDMVLSRYTPEVLISNAMSAFAPLMAALKIVKRRQDIVEKRLDTLVTHYAS